MKTLKHSFVTNLQIALTLRPIETVYLLNHQDCGAIRAFLPCSGYPASGEVKKKKEICINAKILTSAQRSVSRRFPQMEIILGLIDSNGNVANYNVATKAWTIVHVGHGEETSALWYGFEIDQVLTFHCCK
jgi:carbonic anhydrase